MMSTASQTKNDCAIVAISNATGMSYDDIAKRLPQPDKRRGIQNKDWTALIESLGWIKQRTIPRRGQDRITGIVRMISNKRASGHLVYMKNGIVYDSQHLTGLPIKEYQLRHTKCHIQMIWIKPSVLIDIQDTEVSLDFLRSLDK